MKAFLTDRYFRAQKSFSRMKRKLLMLGLRREAHKARKKFIARNGKSAVNKEVKRAIKEYARERFGKAAYWPYLALYTEARGEFIRGWIPFDYFLHILEPKLNPPVYRDFGSLKTYDYRRFGDFAVEPLFVRVLGLYYNSRFEVVKEEELRKFMATYDGNIVVKQEFGWGGNQVQFMHASEFSPDKLVKGLNYVIQPEIKQYKLLHELHPDSVNTLRVTTFLKKDGSVDIVFVILRFGVDGSKVDNLVAGGSCVAMDPDGNPAPVAYDDFGYPGGETHKNTGFRFSDLKLPMYHEIIARCKKAHQQNPYIRLIGWDVCVDESGTPKLLEWNTGRPTFDMEDALLGPFFPDDSEF